MVANYIPIYKAKPGELKAIVNAKKAHDRRMLPLFEISRIGKSVREAKRFKECTALTCAYLDEIADHISQVRKGKSVMVDAFQWKADSITETGEHILPYVYSRLEAQGVSVIPVIGYDRWDSDVYRISMQNFELKDGSYYCLRLDSHAIEDAEDPVFFEERIFDILAELEVEPVQCAVLLDFGDITALSVEDLIASAERVMQVVATIGFKFFATAGCSMPSTIDKAVKNQDSAGKVLRKEMLLWQTMRVSYPDVRWLFSDYGVRGPNTADDIISPHTNGKIRHTIDRSYYVVRGHSVQFGDGGAQMYNLAKKIVDSGYYMGEDFSWGDGQILACSQIKTGPGNSTTWIAIDTSHHLAWVVAEIEEFELKISTSGQRAGS